ncbi:MAG: hypothetical protein C0601_04195 [Candidatus Muiribacterium halophilum]|uniref:ABC transporter substrate-binding protein n=1 Tax=Muiribacterium halophilum TaxID=2053465 RepID=A0A2N5ZJ44_MUIH1|nr:MAG: hypothetical protein C0601_04195 [Candidatus Muirbacterium halophilum]
MKKLVLILVIALITTTFMLTGCGEPDPAKGKTKVVFWHAMGGTLGDVLTGMIDDFNKQNPDIYVDPQFMGNYQTLSQKLMAAAQVHNTPTLAQAYEAWTQNFIDSGIVEPVENFMTDSFDKDDFFKVMIDNNTFNGKIYSFPFNKSMPVLYVNRDILKEAGIDKIPSTQKELLEAYRKITATGKYHGTAFSAKDVWNFLCLILQNGGKITNEDETKAYFQTPEAKKALEYLMTIIKEDLGYLTNGYDHQAEFLAKKVGIITSSSVSKAYMEDSVTFDWATAPLPKGVKNAAILSGTNIIIFNDNKDNCSPEQQAAAWKFIKWFTDTEQTAYWSIMTNYMPVRKSSLDTKQMKEHLAKEPLLKAALDQLPYAQFEPKSSKWYQCRQELGDIQEKAFTEKGDIDKYLKEMNDKINKFLNEGK